MDMPIGVVRRKPCDSPCAGMGRAGSPCPPEPVMPKDGARDARRSVFPGFRPDCIRTSNDIQWHVPASGGEGTRRPPASHGRNHKFLPNNSHAFQRQVDGRGSRIPGVWPHDWKNRFGFAFAPPQRERLPPVRAPENEQPRAGAVHNLWVFRPPLAGRSSVIHCKAGGYKEKTNPPLAY